MGFRLTLIYTIIINLIKLCVYICVQHNLYMSISVFEIKRTIKFFLEKRRDENGDLISSNVPIRMAITYKGIRVMFFAGFRVDSKKWDEKKQRVKNNTTHGNGIMHTDINDRLVRMEMEMNSFFKSCEVEGYVPTKEQVKEAFDLATKGKSKKVFSFFDAYDDFVSTMGEQNSWSADTYGKFSVIRNHLKGFNENLSFSDLSVDTMIKYTTYLRVDRNMRNTTIKKSYSFVKWFFKWAKQKYEVPAEVLDFQPKLKGTDGALKKVIFLNLVELKHLASLEIPEHKAYLDRVRDVFVFCCFTGLRYSDAYNLKKSDRKGEVIEFVTQKTSELIRVQLNNYARAVLEKYSDVPLPAGKALPVITNQKMNEYLKELGKLAGLDDPETIVYFKGNKRFEETYPKHVLLSTHCARKTFVTNLIYLGVNDHVIMGWTGHKDLKSFNVYHKIVDDIKEREMSKFDNI